MCSLGTLVQLVLEGAPKEEFEEVQNFCLEVGLPVTLEEIGVTTPEQARKLSQTKLASRPKLSINLAGDVQLSSFMTLSCRQTQWAR